MMDEPFPGSSLKNKNNYFLTKMQMGAPGLESLKPWKVFI